MNMPVVMITGAGRGIGRASAIEFAANDYRLVLVARTEADLDETIRLAGAAERSLRIVADVSKPADVARATEAAMARFGRIDALVNNAGYAPVLGIEETTDEEWHRVIDTNLSAAFYCCRAVWPVFRRQNGGVIVNISTAATRDPFPGFAAYGAAKAGLNLFGLSAAREGRPMNIRVHTIAPGAVETEMLRGIASEDLIPRSQTLEPAHIARLIAGCVKGDLTCTSGEIIWVHK